jgi:hypothetical protein
MMVVFSHKLALLLWIGAVVLSYQCSAHESKAHEKILSLVKDIDDDFNLVNFKVKELVASDFNDRVNRALEIGDFARFNELFKDAQLLLADDVTLEEEGLASLNIRNLVCTDFNLGDLQTEYEVFQENGNDVLAYTITAQPFAMRCYADYSYSLLSFLSTFGLPSISDDGRFSAVTTGNMVKTRIDLMSPSFDIEPPSSADVEFCDAVINIDGGIDFEDGVLDDILELFGEPIANLVQDEAAKGTLCSSYTSNDM